MQGRSSEFHRPTRRTVGSAFHRGRLAFCVFTIVAGSVLVVPALSSNAAVSAVGVRTVVLASNGCESESSLQLSARHDGETPTTNAGCCSPTTTTTTTTTTLPPPTTTTTTTTTTLAPVKIISSPPPLPPKRSVVVSPFAEGSFALSAKLKSQIQQMAVAIKGNHYSSVDLTGYTDNVFTPAFNATLDLNRAQAVATQLSSDLAALKDSSVKISVVPGYSVVLVSTNATAQGRAANRRVVASLKAN